VATVFLARPAKKSDTDGGTLREVTAARSDNALDLPFNAGDCSSQGVIPPVAPQRIRRRPLIEVLEFRLGQL
jgi:hypothetical protein